MGALTESGLRRRPLCRWVCLFVAPAGFLFVIGIAGAAGAVEAPSKSVACDKMSWQQCAQVIGNMLQHPDAKANLRTSVRLVDGWNAKFKAAYLAANGQRSQKDIDKLEEAVGDELDPIAKAKDKAIDALIKQYLPRLATIWVFLKSGPMQGLLVWLTPSETASDLDQLIHANEEIQQTVAERLAPVLVDDWRNQFRVHLQKSFERVAGPAIENASPFGGSHRPDPNLCKRLGTCK